MTACGVAVEVAEDVARTRSPAQPAWKGFIPEEAGRGPQSALRRRGAVDVRAVAQPNSCRPKRRSFACVLSACE